MQSWKRKAVLLLATSAALFGFFWATAFSAEKVAQMEAHEANVARAVTTAPAHISKNAGIMDVDETILRKGGNGRTC